MTASYPEWAVVVRGITGDDPAQHRECAISFHHLEVAAMTAADSLNRSNRAADVEYVVRRSDELFS